MISPQTSSGLCGQPSCRPQKPSNKRCEQGRHSSLPTIILLQPGPPRGTLLKVNSVFLGFTQNTSKAGQTGAGKAARGKAGKPTSSDAPSKSRAHEFPAVRSRGRGFFLDGTILCSHLSSPRRQRQQCPFTPTSPGKEGWTKHFWHPIASRVPWGQ